MENLSMFAFRQALVEKDTAVLPIGALEGHGPHLPLATDNYIASWLAATFAQQVNAFLLPTLPYGQVWSTANFPGTLSLREQTLTDILVDIAMSLDRQGVRYLVIVNSHYGNLGSMKAAARELAQASTIKTMTFTHPELKKHASAVTDTSWCHPSYMHADETETSMMLSIAPEHVDMDLAVKEYPDFPIWFDYTPVRWEDVTKSGVLGDATAATKCKGDTILNGIVHTMIKIYQQYRRDNNG